jgi:hypothetical protein
MFSQMIIRQISGVEGTSELNTVAFFMLIIL